MDRRVRVPKTAELIADRLRREIIKGVLVEGESLPSEKELMDEFGVSRPTLREAYRILESEGLIEVRRGANGGGRVHAPHIDVLARNAGLLLQFRGVTLAELYDASVKLEAPCAADLARTRTKADIERLRRIIDEADSALEGADEDQTALVELQHQFHALVAELAGNQAVSIIASVVDSVLFLANAKHAEGRIGTASQRRHFELAQDQHTMLVDRIEAGDPEGAEALWRKHLDDAAALVLRGQGKTSLVELFA